jgi:hypothetical protein
MARLATHRTCESYHRLDVRELARDGLLSSTGTITWSRVDQVTGRITVCGDGDSVTLAYVTNEQNINERITLSKTHVNFGGERCWFLCPGCDRRVGVLYGGTLFRCRHCHDLRYVSQRESKSHRAISRIQRTRVKLGGSSNLTKPLPNRPRYMHHRTYERLVREETTAWQAYTFTGRHYSS